MRILTDCFKKAVASAAVVQGDERFFHQVCKKIEDICDLDVTAGPDSFRGLECPSASEYGEATEKSALVLRE